MEITRLTWRAVSRILGSHQHAHDVTAEGRMRIVTSIVTDNGILFRGYHGNPHRFGSACCRSVGVNCNLDGLKTHFSLPVSPGLIFFLHSHRIRFDSWVLCYRRHQISSNYRTESHSFLLVTQRPAYSLVD